MKDDGLYEYEVETRVCPDCNGTRIRLSDSRLCERCINNPKPGYVQFVRLPLQPPFPPTAVGTHLFASPEPHRDEIELLASRIAHDEELRAAINRHLNFPLEPTT